ncbi:MAG: RNA polymerase sigma factor [Actinomycetota bacterium]|jgi:RNA polymerase sigma-70 factor (ECF subfamily)
MDGPRAFEEFFEENRRRLFGALCAITGSRDEAEEILQDAFLRLWERWDRVSMVEDPVGFLFRTAINVFRNRLRRARVAVRKTLTPGPSTDDLAAVESRSDLISTLRGLTPQQRAALVLTGYLGYSSEEAARVLGVRASTVRALATQGRASARAKAEELT